MGLVAEVVHLKRLLAFLSITALLVVMLFVMAPSAYTAAKQCSSGDPGCKTESTTETTHPAGESGGFNVETTETQRGNVDAKGTEDTETSSSSCTGPSGNELRADHPQCS